MRVRLHLALATVAAASLIAACTLEAGFEGGTAAAAVSSVPSTQPIAVAMAPTVTQIASAPPGEVDSPPESVQVRESQTLALLPSPTWTPPATYLTLPPEWLTPPPTSTPTSTPILVATQGSSAPLDLPSGQIVFTRTVWMDPDDPSPAGGACHIFIMNTDGTGVQDLTPTSRTCNTAPAYSPDGALIAYVEGQRSSGNTIWIMSADGSNARQLSSRGYFQTYGPLVWSQDGTRVAIHYPGDFMWHVHALIDGQEAAALDKLSPAEWHLRDISPDGRLQAAYCHPDPENPTASALCLTDRSTGSEVVIPTPPLSLTHHMISWSPDGQWLLVEGSEGQCFTVRSDGSQLEEMSQCFSPAWHP